MPGSRASRPVAVLVLGMHRSGTSALTRVLNWMGVELGGSLMAPAAQNETGFWEHDDIVAVHDRLLEALGSSWHDPRLLSGEALASDSVRPFRDELLQILRRDFADVPLWGLKDPRVCRLLPLWHSLLDEMGCDARYVLTSRHPAEVAASLEARDGFPTPHSEMLWLAHTLAAERETRDRVRTFVTYEQLMANGSAHAARIATELGLDASDALARHAADIDAFLDPKHRHHAQPEPPAHAWLRAVHEAFHAATVGTPFPTHLDALADTVEASYALFRPWIDTLEAERDRSRTLVQKRDAKIAQLRAAGVTSGGERDASVAEQPVQLPAILRQAGTTIRRTYDAPEGEPEVSIVVPLFNQAALTLQCLESLAEHTRDGSFEIILVDNASTDETSELLENLEGNVKIVANEKNLGFAQACNQGAAAASTDLVLFLNNDIEASANWLDPMLEIMQKDPRVGIVGSKLLFPDRTIQHAGVVLCERPGSVPLVATHLSYQSPEDHGPANERREYQAVTGACLLIRKKLFDEVGAFDTFYWNGLEDIDLCLKVRERGYKIVFEPTSVLIHHESQSGPERFARARENERLFCQRWLGKVEPDFAPLPNGQYGPTGNGQVRPYDVPVEGTVRVASTGEPLVSIVILTRNQLEYTRACFESIRRHTGEPHEIVFVDNASTDRTREYLGHLVREHPNVRVVAKAQNLGFAGGNNQGLALARGRHVVLLNNDTVVTEGWIAGLMDVLEAHPGAGIVGPITNYASGPQVLAEVPYRTLPEMERFARNWMDEHSGESVSARRLVGFCWMMRREVLDAIGGFDEVFETGNCEDDDYCLRAHQAGFATRIARGVFIHHTGSRTFAGEKIDYAALLATNFGRFKEKWGMDPSTPPENGYPFEKLVAGPKQPRVELPDVASRHLPKFGGRWFEDKAAPAVPVRRRKSSRRRRTVKT